jgi:hypothetical protein
MQDNINKTTLKQSILLETTGPWRVQWKNDGFDYQDLLNRFLAGEITGQRLATETSDRTVHKVQYADRLFVIKHDTEVDKRLEKRLWFYLAGTMYSRLIHLTVKAINQGCPVLQDVYLVKEKVVGRLCQEAYIIAEYVPGQGFMKEEYEEGRQAVFLRPGENLPLIAEALSVLHSYGLASNDVKISNFILTSLGKVKIIDLSPKTPILLAKINDILEMKKNYDTEVPINSWYLKILVKLMTWRQRLKHLIRVWRKKVPAQKPPKIWQDLSSSSQPDQADSAVKSQEDSKATPELTSTDVKPNNGDKTA